MKKYDVKRCELLRAEEIARGIYDFTLSCPEFACAARPGQFVHILLPGRTLRRPISICGIDPQQGTLRLVFQVRGQGTAQLADCSAGEVLDLLGPLGNGFTLSDPRETALFVGGGIGVPPLLAAARFYGQNAVAALGFRNREAVILTEDFQAAGCRVKLATDNGSLGHHGLVLDLIREETPDRIYACGPAPMLKAVSEFAREKNIPCEISLEERMACGIGACLGCACRLREEDGREVMGHVCKDGPVFPAEKVIF